MGDDHNNLDGELRFLRGRSSLLRFAFVVATVVIGGCNSKEGNPGRGTGGMGGGVGTGCTDPLMIDDMEDGDPFVCASGDRHGDWYTMSDDSSMNLSPSPTGAFTQTLIPGGRGASRYAARMTGSSGTSGRFARMGLHLNGQGTAAQPYDASAADGVRFWMKSNGPVAVAFPIPETSRLARPEGRALTTQLRLTAAIRSGS